MRVIFSAIIMSLFWKVAAAGSCTKCEEGTFCFNEILQSCPANATSPVGSFNLKNCTCNPGYYEEDTTCDLCGIGFYCTGALSRYSCPQHRTTKTKYSSILDDCECMKGYSPDNEEECVGCLAGKYKDLMGMHSCTSCPKNKYSASVASFSVSDCLDCPTHSLSVESSDHVSDCICIPGFFRETEVLCSPCPLGTFEYFGNCVNCAVGSYNSYQNATSCLPCQENSNTNTDGSMSYEECICLAGYIRQYPDGVPECTACPKGKYEENGKCLSSPRNTFVNVLASFSPTDCPANSTTTGEGATSIDDCLCGVGFEKSNDKCIQCAVGKFKSSVNASICQPCAPGSFTAKLQSQECTPCAQNTFQPESGGSQCLTCTPNSLSVSGASSVGMCECDAGFAEVDGVCVQCGFGFYKASVANQACDQCSPGKSTKERQMVTVTACETCPSDHYSFLNGTDFVCQDCPDFSSSGSGSYNVTQCQCRSGFEFSSEGCRECAMGKYKDQFGNTDCVSCPGGMQGKPDANRRTSISSSCIDCESGKYENNNICVSCHSNSASAVKSTAVTDCICHVGFEFNSVDCIACDKGKYKDQQSNSVYCTSCLKGTYNHLLSQSECSLCPGNMTTRESQSQDFSECECDASLGFVSSGSSCHLCGAGSYAKDDSCEQCPAGTYYPTQKPPFLLNRCTSCPSDMYSNNGTFGVDGCVCVAGFTRNTSRSCVPCVVNSYCPSQHQQTPCPPFSENSGGAHSQEQCHCAAGYFGTAEKGCVLCEKDNYCTGGETQTKCRLNSTTRGLQGRSDGNACVCNAGFFEDTDLSCTRCPVDSYCFNDSITHCPPNSSAFLKSDSITDCRCSFGLYMHESTCKTCDPSVLCLGGQSDPVSCSTGALVENGQCVCAKGTYCDTDKLESGCVTPHTCVVCPVGSRCENNERTPCHANSSTPLGSDLSVECVCLDGWYLEQGRCKDCPLHHYCVMDEKAHCLDWDANLRTIDLYNYERTHCECEVGYFRLNYNDTCKPCPKDFYCPKESTQDLPNILACFENEYTEEERSYKRTDCICDAGSKFVSDGPTAKCLPCAEGERCVNGIVQEEFCHIGFRVANSDHSACVCISGFEEGPSKNCRPCAMGHFKSVIGDHSCTACPAGSFSVNSTTCLPCASDRESIEGSSECLCKAPLIEIEQECHLCEDGFYYHGTPDNATCKACQNFATSIPRADELQQECFCIPGYSMSTQNDCLPCAKDTFWEDGECVSCGMNLQSPVASISRDNCSCEVCTSLNWVGVHECYASCAQNPRNCSACPTGKFKGFLSEQGNLDLCQECDVHRYSDEEGLSSCSFCPPTRMTNDVGSTSPDHCRCRPGFTELNATSVENCSMCGLGHFKPIEGNQACTPCADGSFADALGMLECKQCSTHSEVRHANKTYENFGAVDVSSCTCAKGYFSDNTSNVCSPCVTGSFKHEKGFDPCFFCGDSGGDYDFNFVDFYGRDEVAAISTAHCIECPKNSGQHPHYIPDAFVMDEIDDCLCYPGYERKSKNITSGCIECADYMFKVGYNNHNCSFCSENEFYIDIISSCSICQLKVEDSNKFHSFAANRVFENITWGVDQQDCVCDVGYHRNDITEEARCIACTPGHYRNDIMNDPRTLCLECPLNQYSDETATVYCTDCPLNSFTYDTGSTDVDNCRCSAGFEWSVTHSTCNACPPGKFKASDDTVSERYECLQCADGTFSDGNASTSCQLCGDNMHSTLPRDGRERCECDPGFGGAACTTCAIGSYSGGGTSDDQHKECQACPVGKTTFSNTSKYIQQCACLPGYGISPGTDPLPEHTCIICQDGYYATGLTNVPCTHCGRFGVTEPELGATHFDACMCNHEIGVFETEYLL